MKLRKQNSLSDVLWQLGLSNLLTAVAPLLFWVLALHLAVPTQMAFAHEERVNLAEKKVSRIYSAKELTELLASAPLQSIMGEIRGQLDLVPEEKKKKISDSEIAFRWGSDWFGLGEHLRANDQLEKLMKRINEDFVVSKRYIPPYKANRKQPVLQPDWTVIPGEKIARIISHPYAPRIMEIDKALPGFAGWLLEGSIEVPWVLANEPLTQKYCQNDQVHQIKRSAVACQNLDLVKIQKSWFEKETSKDRSKVLAEVFIHELIRYRVNLLAQGTRITQATQDAITAQITESILNSNTNPEELYHQLAQSNLIIEPSRIHELRVYEIVLTMKRKMAVLAEMIQFNMICNDSPAIDKRPFEIGVQKALEQVTECEKYLTPEYDQVMCEIKTVAFHIWDHRVRCLKQR